VVIRYATTQYGDSISGLYCSNLYLSRTVYTDTVASLCEIKTFPYIVFNVLEKMDSLMITVTYLVSGN